MFLKNLKFNIYNSIYIMLFTIENPKFSLQKYKNLTFKELFMLFNQPRKERKMLSASNLIRIRNIFLINLLVFLFIAVLVIASENMGSIIIDGARYSETFGDSTHQYIPNMGNLASQGTIINTFYNDSITYTSRAIPALWCGTWTETIDTTNNGYDTQYTVKPTLFEYYRKQKNAPASQCYYVLKYITSLWLPSFDPDYGPDYWPTFHSRGSSDKDVATEAQWVMNNYHPQFLWIYLADVDHAGHSGNWTEYTTAIQIADSIVALIWNKIKADPFYQNSTTLFITNDHGRHDDQHGGFRHHGCGCYGCRHIMFLALGPQIKQNYISNQYRRIPDVAVTASYILGIDPNKASGEVMTELFETSALDYMEGFIIEPGAFHIKSNYPNPFNPSTTIEYSLRKSAHVTMDIYNHLGRRIVTLIDNQQNSGLNRVLWDGRNSLNKPVSSGIYICRIQVEDDIQTRKMILHK